jgi:hypothetical protein
VWAEDDSLILDPEMPCINFNVVHAFATGLVDQYLDFSNQNSKPVDPRSQEDALYVDTIGFNGYAEDTSSFSSLSSITLMDDQDKGIEPQVIGEPLIYPNPYRQSYGNAYLYYQLSKNMDLTWQLYNMLGQMVVKTTFHSGSEGGRKGKNKIALKANLLEETPLSAGIYFVVLINAGKVLAKAKMAVKP